MTQGRTCNVRRSLRKTYEQHEATAQRKSQVGRGGPHDSFLSFRICRFVADGSSENRRKLIRKLTKILARSPQNRRKIDLGPSRTPKTVSGTRPDALGAAFGRPNAAPEPILGHPGRAKSGQELSKSVAGASFSRSKWLRDNSQNARNAVRVAKRSRKRLRIDF